MCRATPTNTNRSNVAKRIMNKKRVRFNMKQHHTTTTTTPKQPLVDSPDDRKVRWYSASCLQQVRRDNQRVLQSLSSPATSKDDMTCLRGLELFTPNNSRHMKRRMFVRGLLELQKRTPRKTSLRIFSAKFAKYARDYARKIAAEDAKEAHSIYFRTTAK